FDRISEERVRELTRRKDEKGLNVLNCAVFGGSIGLINKIIGRIKNKTRGSSREKNDKEATRIVEALLGNLSENEGREMIREKSNNGWTAVHVAAEKATVEVVEA